MPMNAASGDAGELILEFAKLFNAFNQIELNQLKQMEQASSMSNALNQATMAAKSQEADAIKSGGIQNGASIITGTVVSTLVTLTGDSIGGESSSNALYTQAEGLNTQADALEGPSVQANFKEVNEQELELDDLSNAPKPANNNEEADIVAAKDEEVQSKSKAAQAQKEADKANQAKADSLRAKANALQNRASARSQTKNQYAQNLNQIGQGAGTMLSGNESSKEKKAEVGEAAAQGDMGMVQQYTQALNALMQWAESNKAQMLQGLSTSISATVGPM